MQRDADGNELERSQPQTTPRRERAQRYKSASPILQHSILHERGFLQPKDGFVKNFRTRSKKPFSNRAQSNLLQTIKTFLSCLFENFLTFILGNSIALQGSAKRLRPGLVKFILAIAYHFCLSLPVAFMKPGRSLLVDLCTDF